MKKRTKIVAGIALTITVLAGLYLLQRPKAQGNKNNEAELEVEYFTIEGVEQVFINGSVTPVRSQEFVKDPALGKLGELQVENGALVAEGTLLYQYIDPNSDKEVSDIEANIQSTQADRYKAARQMELELQDLGKATTSEEGAPAAANTETNRESIALKYDINGFDVRLSQMQQQLDDVLERQINKVTAPFKGKVSVPQDKNRDSAIMSLTSEEFYVVGDVNEKDVEKIKVKQQADIQTISNKKNLNGTITYISELPNSVDPNSPGGDGSLSKYTVKLSIDKAEGIRNGFHVQAAVNLQEKKIMIPTNAIAYDDKQAYVLVDDFGTVLRKNIVVKETAKKETTTSSTKEETTKKETKETKKTSDKKETDKKETAETEVVSGLESMDRLIISASKKLKDGDLLQTDKGEGQ